MRDCVFVWRTVNGLRIDAMISAVDMYSLCHVPAYCSRKWSAGISPGAPARPESSADASRRKTS